MKVLSYAEWNALPYDEEKYYEGPMYWSCGRVIEYRKNGKAHKEFGPALELVDPSFKINVETYYLDGHPYKELDYWKEMYRRYKGTDKEELVLAYLLAGK